MNRVSSPSLSRLSAMLLGFACGLAACHARPSEPAGLTTVDNPGGGQFVYGSLTGQSTKADAMVFMLHQVHLHFGDKPQLGKFVQSRDGSSLASFFTLNAKTLGGRPLAGLVIVSMPGKGTPQAAVLYDDLKHFPVSEPSMMNALTTAWKGSQGASASSTSASLAERSNAGAQAAAGSFHTATMGDRSASVRMPDSWRLLAVSGGQLMAEGNRGEMVQMGMMYQNIVNPQTPMGQHLIGGPMASRGPKVICPLSSNLFSDYVCVVNQVRRNNGKSPGNFSFLGSQPQGNGPGGVRPIVARYTVDFNDGMGPRNASAYLTFLGFPNPGSGSWAMMASASNIPAKFGTAVDPTLKAVVESYRQDSGVIGREGSADLERIHQQGIANQAQADAINSRREASKQSFDNHMQTLRDNDTAMDRHNGDIDWQSKITQDYILDRSVIRDTGNEWHATTSNDFADALIKANPNKVELVPNQELIRGRDY